jgi:competence ComEA-like helix-hairpin-helix protein
MNRSQWVFAVLIILLLFGMTGISRADTPTADELYRSGQQAYLDFDNERAVELLMKALERDPDHKQSRALLEEMGRDVPPPSHFKKSDQESDGSDTAADSRTDRDTETRSPADRVDEGTSAAEDETTVETGVSSAGPADVQIDTPTLQATEDTSSTKNEASSPDPDTSGADAEMAESSPAVSPESRASDTPVSAEEGPTNRRVSGDTSPDDEQTISVPESPTNPTASVPPSPVVPAPAVSDNSADTGPSEGTSEGRGLITPDLTQDTQQGSARGEGPPNQILPTLRGTDAETSETTSNESGNMGSRASDYRPNINSVDASQLQDQFGSELASKIVEERRDRGFYLSWTEFRERISPGRRQFESIRESFTLAIPVVNINTASVKRLSSLPYMTADIADNIVNFRFTYGDYSSVDQLLDVPGMTESSLERVKPYLEAR